MDLNTLIQKKQEIESKLYRLSKTRESLDVEEKSLTKELYMTEGQIDLISQFDVTPKAVTDETQSPLQTHTILSPNIAQKINIPDFREQENNKPNECRITGASFLDV